MPKEEIELEDIETGAKVSVPIAHYRRWKTSLDVRFRPVAEKKATPPVVVTPAPTGDENKEN